MLASEKYLSPYLSFKLSVRDKTWNWWIFPNRNLEHKYFEKLQKFCYLAKLWVLRSFTCWWKMIPGVSNLPKFWTFFSHYLFIHKKTCCTVIPLWQIPVSLHFIKGVKTFKKESSYKCIDIKNASKIYHIY